jgi:hypothetical protein
MPEYSKAEVQVSKTHTLNYNIIFCVDRQSVPKLLYLIRERERKTFLGKTMKNEMLMVMTLHR